MIKMFVSLVLATVSLAGADLTGKWSGTFEGVANKNQPRSLGAFFVLKEAGGVVTGTVGPSEAEQMEIRKGKLAGKKLTFEVPMPDGGVFRFTLVFDGQAIKGEVSGQSPSGDTLSGKLALKRL